MGLPARRQMALDADNNVHDFRSLRPEPRFPTHRAD